jgi:hypothetical protein
MAEDDVEAPLAGLEALHQFSAGGSVRLRQVLLLFRWRIIHALARVALGGVGAVIIGIVGRVARHCLLLLPFDCLMTAADAAALAIAAAAVSIASTPTNGAGSVTKAIVGLEHFNLSL